MCPQNPYYEAAAVFAGRAQLKLELRMIKACCSIKDGTLLRFRRNRERMGQFHPPTRLCKRDADRFALSWDKQNRFMTMGRKTFSSDDSIAIAGTRGRSSEATCPSGQRYDKAICCQLVELRGRNARSRGRASHCMLGESRRAELALGVATQWTPKAPRGRIWARAGSDWAL